MSHVFATLKSATAIGYAIGAFAVAAITGIAATAKYTGDTRSAIGHHDSTSTAHDAQAAARDTQLLAEVRAMHRDQVAAARKQTCVLVAESAAERRACERRNYVEEP